NNWVGVHPGEGFLGVVDGDQRTLKWTASGERAESRSGDGEKRSGNGRNRRRPRRRKPKSAE
ncbi:hypothetical protein, partial [Aeromonas taiwanensis]|uniref:hypothetical protein n=1 Tax=Aeromonas taiwanensis TaxID=633417 RepID=UPI003F74846A